MYDPNGNLTDDGTNTYTWNARNQLASMSGGISASFGYDGLGRRRSKTLSGTSTQFSMTDLNLVQELVGGPDGEPAVRRYRRALYANRGSDTNSFLVDALGSTVELADSSGSLQTHYTFDPFGATMTSGASSTNAAQFSGREYDGIGLYFYRARYYSPSLHRFTSEDRIDWSDGLNLYAYVNNDPVDFVDPEGLAGQRGRPGRDRPWQGDPGRTHSPDGTPNPDKKFRPDPTDPDNWVIYKDRIPGRKYGSPSRSAIRRTSL